MEIIIACDFSTKKELFKFLKPFKNELLFLKLGMQLIYNEGFSIISKLKKMGHRIFLDLKLHDIPNTVNKAINGLIKYKPDYITVHVSGGQEMIKEALAAMNNSKTKLVGVTWLTSLDEQDLNKIWQSKASIIEHVQNLIKQGYEVGLRNFVLSNQDIENLNLSNLKDAYFFTPGIGKNIDQKRFSAFNKKTKFNGNFLIIGRLIYQNKNPYLKYCKLKNILEK